LNSIGLGIRFIAHDLSFMTTAVAAAASEPNSIGSYSQISLILFHMPYSRKTIL
jgi:hypothetical protein